MPIEEINTSNTVRHVRETQRELRVNAGDIRGRFVPPSELAALADALTAGLTHREIADVVGEHQSAVTNALNGNNTACALRIITHYLADRIDLPFVEYPLAFIPEAVDDLAAEHLEEAMQEES